MKTKLFLSALIVSSFLAKAQNASPGTNNFIATMNNYITTFQTNGDMNWGNPSLGYKTIIPKNSGVSPVFASSIWIGGYSQGTDLRIAAMTYRQNGADFWPGPIDTTTIETDSILSLTYDTFYPIYKSQVDSQINHLYTSSNMPANILNWPANKPSAFNTSYKLAPYQDVNHNNTYDPLNGDYPLMMGDYSVYQIFNDVGNKHTETGSLHNMGMEIHLTNYMIDCPSDSALWNTYFMHYDIINSSSNTFSEFYFTMWSDFDLGYYNDDYVGCDTNLNMYYVYNGDSNDEDALGNIGYHQYLPAMAGLFLNQGMSRFTYYNNNSNSLNGNPTTAQGYYNLMRGVWETGAPMTYGGQGLNVVDSAHPIVNYLYPGDPYASTGWAEINDVWVNSPPGDTMHGNPPGDRRGMGSCGPFTINAGDTLKIDFAYVFARDYTHPGDNVACIPILKQYVQNVQSYYNNNLSPCGNTFQNGINSHKAKSNELKIYPNPANSILNVVIGSSNEDSQEIKIFDVLGNEVATKLINANASIDVSSLQSGIYFIRIRNSTQKFIKQ